MRKQTTEANPGRQWRFVVVAVGVGALTLVSGLWLGAWSSTAPVTGEAEAILMAQPATDTVANGAYAVNRK